MYIRWRLISGYACCVASTFTILVCMSLVSFTTCNGAVTLYLDPSFFEKSLNLLETRGDKHTTLNTSLLHFSPLNQKMYKLFVCLFPFCSLLSSLWTQDPQATSIPSLGFRDECSFLLSNSHVQTEHIFPQQHVHFNPEIKNSPSISYSSYISGNMLNTCSYHICLHPSISGRHRFPKKKKKKKSQYEDTMTDFQARAGREQQEVSLLRCRGLCLGS